MVSNKVALGLFLSFSLAMGYQTVKSTDMGGLTQSHSLKNMTGEDINLLATQDLDEIILGRVNKRTKYSVSSREPQQKPLKIVSENPSEEFKNIEFKNLRTEESLRAEAWLPKTTNENASSKKVQKMQKLALYISNTYRIPIKNAEQIVYTTFEESAKKNLEPILVLSLIDSESGFQQHAKSRVGALGLTQVMPKYHPEKIADLRKNHGTDIYSINGNIKVGTQILREYINKAGGNLQKGLQMYNGSSRDSTRKYSNKIISKMNIYAKI